MLLDANLKNTFHIKIYIFSQCFDCSKEYASLIAARIDGNKTLDLSDYFLDSVPASLLLGDAVKQTGSSHVSVVGPDDDFVAITV